VRVDILGPLVVADDDGKPLMISEQKARAVLCLLALHAGSPVTLGQLFDAGWADYQPDTVKKSVQKYVSQLNRDLFPGRRIQLVDGNSYQLCIDPEDVDVTRFERLLEQSAADFTAGKWKECVANGLDALRLWRGQPLGDLHEDSRASRGDARLLEEKRYAGEDRVFEARLALGEHALLIGELRTAVVERPDAERPRTHLMLALYRSGRQHDAGEEARKFWTVLGDLGYGAPSQAFRELENGILRGDETLLYKPAAPEAPVWEDRPQLPEGNVTFVYSEVDGGATLLAALGAGRYKALLDREQQAVRNAFYGHGGVVEDSVGGGLFAAFGDASRALQACLEAQQNVPEVGWPEDAPIKAQIGVVTCIAHANDPGGYGWAARRQASLICSAAHGGQVLLSAGTARMVERYLPPGATLAPRGSFMLGGFDEPERLYQLVHPELENSFPPLRASPAQSHNLPDTRTSFVGRDGNLEALSELLRSNRLVTVVGTGGVGKTRFAVEAAARVVADFGSGARLCDLSPIEAPALVPAAIASSFGVREGPGVDPTAAVAEMLEEEPALLLLDGCEHLTSAVGEAVSELLAAAPGLTVLATSREPLGINLEQRFPLLPLALPHLDDDLAATRASEAVALFEDRAGLAQPGFAVSQGTCADVKAICRHLGGIPLAIEIVAAQMATLSPASIAERLEAGLPIPEVPGATATAERHRSLESTIDWSYRLLDEEARKLLRFLSVFANGFTEEAARRVGDPPDPIVVLTRLVDKSLVVWDLDAARYRILEPIRAFARARLVAGGEADSAGARHLAWCAAFANSLGPVAGSKESFELFDRELDNFRLALAWAASHSGPESGALAEALREPVQAIEELPESPAEVLPELEWRWEAVVTADRDHFERMKVDGVQFPGRFERRYSLAGDVASVGRRRGFEIDLTHTPTDTGISRDHAFLIRQRDGTWGVVDTGSENGIFLNGASEPLETNMVISLAEGDRLGIGYWTVIEIRRVPLPRPPEAWS
jgi:predicted ATPase/class 3 adenylate cyclase/DNA-binding SARP family transcriptional activator